MGKELNPKVLKEIGIRLRSIRTQAALTIGELSKMINISPKAISNYERGERQASVEYLTLLYEHLEANLEYIVAGKSPMFLEDGIGKNVHLDNIVYIPIYNAKTAAGAGCIIDDEAVIGHYPFEKVWFNKNIFAQKESLIIFEVKGESMEPTIKDRDLIMVDTSNVVIKDGIFVVRLDDTLIVKRLELRPDNKLQVKSDNPEYSTFTVELNSLSGITVIGKVIWQGKKHPQE
jgi:phage repressor protein C with HTH and peptisase S24 domain